LQRINGSVQAVSQQTLSTQLFDAQCPALVQLEPLGCGVGVAVDVDVGVLVAVCVGVEVGVAVDVIVAVAVTVGVLVGVAVGVGLTQVPLRPPLQEPPATKIPSNKVHMVWSDSTHEAESAPDVNPAFAALPNAQHPVVAQVPPEHIALFTTLRLQGVPGVLNVSHMPRQVVGDSVVVQGNAALQEPMLPTFSQEQQIGTPGPE
jgi:hypothetical protein